MQDVLAIAGITKCIEAEANLALKADASITFSGRRINFRLQNQERGVPLAVPSMQKPGGT